MEQAIEQYSEEYIRHFNEVTSERHLRIREYFPPQYDNPKQGESISSEIETEIDTQ